jgi:hypothetical protein
VNVVPKSTLPPNAPATTTEEASLTGVWVFKDGEEPENLDDWAAQEVLIYPEGVEPENAVEGTPSGWWGVHEDPEPKEDDEWLAEEILFFPPEEEPPNEVKRGGFWVFTCFDVKWPPETETKEETKEEAKHKSKPPKPSSVKKKKKGVTKVPELPHDEDNKALTPLERAQLRIKAKMQTKDLECGDDDDDDEPMKPKSMLGKWGSAFERPATVTSPTATKKNKSKSMTVPKSKAAAGGGKSTKTKKRSKDTDDA